MTTVDNRTMTDDEITDLLESIDKSLKGLLHLRIENQFGSEATNKDKVKLLYPMGFSNQEMAEIVGTSTSSIRGTVSTLKDEGEIEE